MADDELGLPVRPAPLDHIFKSLPAHAPSPSKRASGEEAIERSDLFKRWQRLRPPLRPHESDVAALDRLTRCDGPRLLLGVTPELAALGGPLVAIDWSATMIARIWPGNDATAQVIQADWRAMPFDNASFGGAMGDGIVNMLRWPDELEAVARQLSRVVRPGGTQAFRTFCAPDERETLPQLRDAVFANGMTFHAFKWRLAQAAMEGDNIEARAVWGAFEAAFPDRAALSAATGWAPEAIAEIDDYRVSALSKCFPTRAALKTLFPSAEFVESSGYELAERCPVLVMRA